MFRRFIGLHFLGILMFIVILAGCYGGGTPVEPSADQLSSLPESSLSSDQSRDVIAVYDAIIDPIYQTFKIEPSLRELNYHGSIAGLYPNCLTIDDYGWSPNFWVDIKLTHPLPGSGIIVFDPRVIAILPANPGVSFNYPVLNCVGNNGAVLEPDGYTKLFDSLGGSIPGNANPFKAYFKDQPNRRWMDQGAASTETQRWQINLSGMPIPFQYKLVVDISTNYPQLPTPVVDNAPEPIKIEATVGEGLRSDGGRADIAVTLLDWQGQAGIGGVKVESPVLFNGTINLTYSGPGPNPNEYSYAGTIRNSLLAPAGDHKFLVATWDQATGINIFKEITVAVIEAPPPCGNLVWAKQGTGSTHYDQLGKGITTLSDNSTVVTGQYSEMLILGSGEPNETTLITEPHDHSIFIARYNPDGTLAWAKGIEDGGNNIGKAITALSDNSTVITGRFNTIATFGSGEPNETTLTATQNADIFIARYNPDGTLAWVKSVGYPSSGGYYNYSEGITTLSDNSTIVTGAFEVHAIFGKDEPNETVLTAVGFQHHDIFIARYNPDGTLAWAKSAGGGQNNDCGYGITTLSDDSTIVIGQFWGPATFGKDEPNETILDGHLYMFIAKYNPDGTLAWAKRANGPSDGHGITTLSDDTAVVTGYFKYSTTFGEGDPNETILTTPEGMYEDIFIARYNPDGTLAWAKRAGGIDHDQGYGVSACMDDSVVVTGYFTGSSTFGEGDPNETILTSPGLHYWGDIFIARYRPDGTLAWVKQAGSDYEDIGWEITTLSDNSSVATGSFSSTAVFGPGEPNETTLTNIGDQFFIARFEP